MGLSAPKIDREFAELCPALTPEERNLLEASIEAEGCRDALIVWKQENLLLDGHNRIDICGSFGCGCEWIQPSSAVPSVARN